jgi:hypothetical protein
MKPVAQISTNSRGMLVWNNTVAEEVSEAEKRSAAAFCAALCIVMPRSSRSERGAYGRKEAEQMPVDAVGALDREKMRRVRQDHEFGIGDARPDVLPHGDCSHASAGGR